MTDKFDKARFCSIVAVKYYWFYSNLFYYYLYFKIQLDTYYRIHEIARHEYRLSYILSSWACHNSDN